MILVLFLYILLIFYVNLKANRYDYVAPNSIVQIMAIFMLLILALNVSSYSFSISLYSAFLFSLALTSFCLWGIVKPCPISHISRIDEIYLYTKKVIIFSFVFITISTLLYFYEVKKIASLMGFNSSSVYGMLFYYRNATLHYPEIMAQQSKIVGQLTVASFSIAYLILIDFTKRIVFRVRKTDRKLFYIELVTVVLFIVQCILSGGRTQFLSYIEAFLFLLIFLYQKKNKRRVNDKFFRRLIILLIIAFLSFYLLGSFTGKTSIFDFKTTLLVYVGMPLPAFEQLVQGVVKFPQTYFGSNTFWGIFDIVRRLGIDIKVNEMTAPFVSINGIETNIYGSFGRYYADFGVFGAIIIPFILGVFYQHRYRRLQMTNGNIEWHLGIYLILLQYVFDFCIEERFFLSVLSLGSILRIAYMYIFCKLFKMKREGYYEKKSLFDCSLE